MGPPEYDSAFKVLIRLLSIICIIIVTSVFIMGYLSKILVDIFF